MGVRLFIVLQTTGHWTQSSSCWSEALRSTLSTRYASNGTRYAVGLPLTCFAHKDGNSVYHYASRGDDRAIRDFVYADPRALTNVSDRHCGIAIGWAVQHV
jgi:hypothetical protein